MGVAEAAAEDETFVELTREEAVFELVAGFDFELEEAGRTSGPRFVVDVAAAVGEALLLVGRPS